MGVRAERAVYVGDIYAIDVVGARAAGLAPILIDAPAPTRTSIARGSSASPSCSTTSREGRNVEAA